MKDSTEDGSETKVNDLSVDKPRAKQRQFLMRNGYKADYIETLTSREASYVIGRILNNYLPSDKQRQFLMRVGYKTNQIETLTKRKASKIIGSILNELSAKGDQT